MTYKLHSTAQSFLDAVRSHAEPYTMNVLGTDVIVYPEVMSPKYDWSSMFFARNLPDLTGCNVIDMGSGSGVLSLFAALKGAHNVLALDINPAAVESTKANFTHHKLNANRFVVVESDLFSAVESNLAFDYILFNAPFHGTKAQDHLERSISDFEYQLSNKFFKEVAQFLKPEGQILYAFGSMGDLEKVKGFWVEAGFVVDSVAEGHRYEYVDEPGEDWVCYLFVLKKLLHS